jgi:hypothetical protein
MAETLSTKQPIRRFDFQRVFDTLLHPRQAFTAATAEARSTWLTPMLVLSITALLVILVSGYFKSRAAMMGEVTLPPDWQYWTPDMQDNYMQAQQLTQGKVFMYVIPLVSVWTSLWLGWVVLGGLLHLGSTLLGGRGSMQGALNIVAWASLPFALRDLLRIIYMLSASHAITSPGLSGFATSAFFVQVLARTDIFLIWNIVLLIIGFSIVDGLPRGKAFLGVVLVVILLLAAQAGVGTALSGLGGTAVQRPYF